MDDKYMGNRKNSLQVNVNEFSAVENAAGGIRTNGKTNQQREIYKQLAEDSLLPPVGNGRVLINSNLATEEISADDANKNVENLDKQIKNFHNKMEHDHIDGVDDEMLSLENKKLNEKRDEVKFINGDHQNGDAKIDMGVINGKVFTGMTKEELMKYANDPFWVRLRWIFFIGFWVIWAGMLVGAILIIIDAPKCAAPEPLPWYKRGPLAKFASSAATSDDVASAKKMQARGVIYELPPESTYAVHEPMVEQQIKELVAKYKDTEINVVLDITANYANKDSKLMKNALADSTQRSAFIWVEQAVVPTNWLSLVNGSAWNELQPGNFVLAQFGDGLFDLHMSSDIVKQALSETLRHLLALGVKGFRLKNSKYFIVHKNLQDEGPSSDPNYVFTQYGFWTHSQTTFQEGLGSLLYDYLSVVKNVSTDAFLSVSDDLVRPEAYALSQNSTIYGIDLPRFGRFTKFLGSVENADKLRTELQNTLSNIGNTTWLQWDFEDLAKNSTTPSSAYALFMSLIPGTPIYPSNASNFNDIDSATYKHMEQLRESPSFMYGDFNAYYAEGLIAYSRIKSGNPGHLVVYNPYSINQVVDLSKNNALPSKLTVDIFSTNYKIADIAEKSKVPTNKIEVSPHATIVYTYVPVRAE